MKTEMVVRGYANGFDLAHFGTPMVGTSQIYRIHNVQSEKDPSHTHPVTLLLHGENGEVGGLEAWMVEWQKENRLSVLPPDILQLNLEEASDVAIAECRVRVNLRIAAAIANILNPEVSDD